jgi:plasmid stabilization system protein ParE
MAFRVRFTRRARRDYFQLFESINVPAQQWLRGLDETIALLAVTPRMGTATHEDKTVRQVIYGNKPHFYRILYDIDDTDQRVDILSIWHGKRLPPTFLRS